MTEKQSLENLFGHDFEPLKLKVGDIVEKTSGYEFYGQVVAAYYTRSGKARYVVESTTRGSMGLQHIFNVEQLKKINEST